MSFSISKKYKNTCWTDLELLNENNENWEKAILIIKDRFDSRFFSHIDSRHASLHRCKYIGNRLFFDVFGRNTGNTSGAFLFFDGIIAGIDANFLQGGDVFLQLDVDVFAIVYGDYGSFVTDIANDQGIIGFGFEAVFAIKVG